MTPSQPPPIAIEIRGLTRSFGAVNALAGLDLEVYEGDLLGLVGSNGAGKTTTLRILATFLLPTSGTVKVLGHNVVTEAETVRGLIGYMPDFFGVYKDMEVEEYLDFFAACYRIPSARRPRVVLDVLELVGLADKRTALVGTLSRGMQQRLGLARVLIHQPRVLLLDEPASGLDPRARLELMAILQELQRMGKTIIISSHILRELETLCNRIAILEKGRLTYTGPTAGASQRDPHRGLLVWARVAGDATAAAAVLRGRPEVLDVQPVDHGLRIHLAPGEADAGLVAEVLVHGGFRLLELREDRPGLEEVFLRMTTGETQ
ncbi:MAG: ABC transporter ATP-binding protein [Limisphaera sp.]